MYERLLESWLASANERSLQACFVQALIGQKHKVLHSSRHMPIEQGKDIVAIDRRGRPCAFQVKAHGGKRFTLRDFQSIANQVQQLMTTAIQYPGIPKKQHRSILVVSGRIEEEVQQEVRAVNEANVINGYPARTLEVISYHELLSIFRDHGSEYWPADIDDFEKILALWAQPGGACIDEGKHHELLSKMLALGDETFVRPTNRELERRLVSAGLLTAIALRNQYRQQNHYGIISGWVMFAAYAIAAHSRARGGAREHVSLVLNAACSEIDTALSALAAEVVGRRHYVEGDPFTDAVAYPGRRLLLVALMSLYQMKSEGNWGNEEELHNSIDDYLDRAKMDTLLWGEGAIPQALLYYWHLHSKGTGRKAERLLVSLANAILAGALGKTDEALASPYMTYEHVMRHMMVRARILGPGEDLLLLDSGRRQSYFLESILHLLVRTGLKQHCKLLWPDMTRVGWLAFEPASQWRYCLWQSKKGRNVHIVPPLSERWEALKARAAECSCQGVPVELAKRPALLALFVVLHPYRATPAVVRYLGCKFDGLGFCA